MTKNRVNIRILGRTLGVIIVFIALFFMAEKIWSNRLWFLNRQFTKQIVMVIVFGSIAYALSCFLLSTAWQRLLVWFGQSNAAIKNCHAVYARTQIAKYIPGNVFHFAGRHVLGSQVGFGHGSLAGAAIYEVVGILVASSALVLLGIVFYGTNQIKISALSISAIFFVMLLIPLVLNKAIAKFPKLRGFNFQDKKITEIVMVLIPTYFLYVAFFLIIGGILFGVVYAISDIENIHQAGFVIIALAVSWIAGFITPGASAGIGVREAVMVVSLTNFLGEPESLFIALIFRMITVMGDFVFFLSSFAMRINFLTEKKLKLESNLQNKIDN